MQVVYSAHTASALGREIRPHSCASATSPVCNLLTTWCIGWGEIWTSPPKPRSNSRIIPNAPATASAQSVRVTADVRLRGANSPKLANSRLARILGERRTLLAFPVQLAESIASACRRFSRQAPWLDPPTICRVRLQASTQVSNPRAAGGVRMSSDRRGVDLLDRRETDRQS